jgi:hypothetical protein
VSQPQDFRHGSTGSRSPEALLGSCMLSGDGESTDHRSQASGIPAKARLHYTTRNLDGHDLCSSVKWRCA